MEKKFFADGCKGLITVILTNFRTLVIKKENFPVCLWGGGGRDKMATHAILPPPPQVADSPPKQADLCQRRILPHDGWSQSRQGTRCGKSRDKCGFGIKVAIFIQIPQQVVLARNLYSKIDAVNFYLPNCSVKICPPLSCEMRE
jgi:hypothetical protein